MTLQLIYSNPHPPAKTKKQAQPLSTSRESQALELISEGYSAFWDCPEEDQTVNRAVFTAKLKLFIEHEG